MRIWVSFIGADNVIFERLRADQADLKAQTQDHLDVSTIAPAPLRLLKLFSTAAESIFSGNFSI